MNDQLLVVLTVCTALGCGLMAGVFFAFSAFVMRSLGQLPAAQGVSAMQSINVFAVTPLFMATLFGTAAACVALVIFTIYTGRSERAGYLLAGSGVYLVGTILVTIFFNVPLNNALAELDPAAANAAPVWTDYVRRWTRWNHVRTISALAACALLILALLR